MICAENPCMFLYGPDQAKLAFGLSFWHVRFSPWGPGNVAFMLWPREGDLHLHAIGDNRRLAAELHARINRHFEIFADHGSEPELPAFVSARIAVEVDARYYAIELPFLGVQLKCTWADFMHPVRTGAVVERFGHDGAQAYDVQATIIACTGKLAIDGADQPLASSDRYASFDSSAFLSLAENWSAKSGLG